MHMNVLRVFLIITSLTLASCANDEVRLSDPSLKDFQKHLKQDMNYTTLVSTFGQPVKDIGSGIHIYVYSLPDATEVWIGYVDAIVYARQVDAQGNELLRIL